MTIRRMVWLLYCAFSTGLFAQEPGNEIPCGRVEWIDGSTTRDADNPVIIRTFSVALALSGLEVPVHICQVDDPNVMPTAISLFTWDARGKVTEVSVLLPRKTAGLYSDNAYVALMAHELAHAFLPLPAICQVDIGKPLPPIKQRLACEFPVDKLAASWLGTEPLITMLEETQKYTAPYTRPEHRRYAAEEMTARIRHLQRKPHRREEP